MERIPLAIGTPPDHAKVLHAMMDGTNPNPQVVSSIPTTAEMKDNQPVFVTSNTRIYWKINGTLYYFQLTAA